MTPHTNGSTRRRVLLGGLLGLVACAALAASGCERALQVAPSSSNLVLSVPSTTIQLNGTLTITATLTTTAGAAVADGTLVTFSTSLGQLNPLETRVSNGRATTVLSGGSTAGIATITASSGGVSSNSVSVRVGTVPVVGRLTLVVSQTTGAPTVIATVFDTQGNPMPGATVVFTTSSGTLSNPTGITDYFGQAASSLFGSTDAIVTAESSGMRASVAVRIVVPGSLSVNLGIDPTNPLRRQNIVFTATATITTGGTSVPAPVARYEWAFSDGMVLTTTGNKTTRAYENEGVYWATVRVYTVDGQVGMSRVEFYVD
jgi:adhesin/invasin